MNARRVSRSRGRKATTRGFSGMGARALATAALVAAVALAAPAAAVVRYVSPAGTHVDPFTSWGSAATNIQAALDIASAGDEIWVREGTYRLGAGFSAIYVRAAVKMYGGFVGTETVRAARDWRNHETIVDGQNQCYTCFTVSQNAVIDGFTITRGTTMSGYSGAGIYVYESAPEIRNCTIAGNNAAGLGVGGGICSQGNSAAPSIVNCAILNNSAHNGGALYFYYNNSKRAKVINCTIAGNSTTEATVPPESGTIHINVSYVDIHNTILWGNAVASGPQIYVSHALYNPAVNYSDVQGGWGAGTGNMNLDPHFLGGGDYRLQFDSNCRDMAANHLVPADTDDLDGDADTAEALPYDLDKHARIYGSVVDMGAYEYSVTDTDPPGPVTGFAATPGDMQVGLHWSNPGDLDYAGVKVQRKTGDYPSGPDDGVTVYTGKDTAATDGDLENGTPYFYAAFSFDTARNYGPAATASATPRDIQPPAGVSDFSAMPGYLAVQLSWGNPDDRDFTGVRIVRKASGYPLNPNDGTVVYSGTGTWAEDSDLPPGVTCYYGAFAHDEVPNYAAPATASATPEGCVIRGFVTYNGNQSGPVQVFAYTDPTFGSRPVRSVRTQGPGAYALPYLEPGTYYVAAVLLTAPQPNPDAPRIRMTDPWGVYGSFTNPTPVACYFAPAAARPAVALGSVTPEIDGIDMALVDGTREEPDPFAQVGARNDFDGDGRSDYGYYDAKGANGNPPGSWCMQKSSAGRFTDTMGYAGTVPVTGDFDGDGIVDYGCYDAAGHGGALPGSWYFAKSRDGFASAVFGYAGTTPVVGDFDGDGIDDYGCYDAQGASGQLPGSWYFMESREGFSVAVFGYAGTVPVVGDFDGDGIDDYGCYDLRGQAGQAGAWFFMKSRDGFAAANFGYLGVAPVVGDFDGDGTDDYGCYDALGRVAPGAWYFMKSSDGFNTANFGYRGVAPVVGDFDGDGIDDYACYDILGRVAAGAWYFMKSSDGFASDQLGYRGALPLGLPISPPQ